MKTSVLTPFECGSFTKLFSKDRANKYFERGMVVFMAGGTGHPYFSTDTATVLRAVEIEAETIFLAKAVDGVYDSDPKTNPAAKKYDEVSIQEVIDKKLAVVDMTASILCMEKMCIRDSLQAGFHGKGGPRAFSSSELLSCCKRPVSYTHLDVYKRQKNCRKCWKRKKVPQKRS